MSTTEPRPLPPARLAWLVWGLAACLYLAGFYQRVAPAVLTQELMAEFAIGAAALGNLSAFYFYAYVAMQIPTGVMADRLGPRRLLIIGAFGTACGSLLFALAPSLFWANAGRLVIGGFVAVAFVSMLKLSTHWFPANRYALVSGVALLMGVLGGVGAGVPLRLMVDVMGWRMSMALAGAGLLLLGAAIIWKVRNDPAAYGFASHAPPEASDGHHLSVGAALLRVMAFRNTWLTLLAPIGVAGAVLAFAGLWGVPMLVQVHGLERTQAAAMMSVLLVAWAVGGPVLGAWSERAGQRKPLYIVTTVIALVGWLLVALVPTLPLALLAPVLVVVGFASGNIIIGFALAKESTPAQLMGTTAGVCNMGPLMGGMLLQPFMGAALDHFWRGAEQGGVRVYEVSAWQAALWVPVVCLLVSLLAAVLVRETHCRPFELAAEGKAAMREGA